MCIFKIFGKMGAIDEPKIKQTGGYKIKTEHTKKLKQIIKKLNANNKYLLGHLLSTNDSISEVNTIPVIAIELNDARLETCTAFK